MRPYFVGIAGGTGSGKTTFARHVHSRDPRRVSIVPLDAYYYPLNHLTLEEREKVNFDHPDAIDFPLIRAHLSTLHSGGSAEIPVYDFASHNRVERPEKIEPTPIVIVEGILTLHDPELRNFFDFTVYVDTPDEIRLQRRLERDVRERGRTRELVNYQWENTVCPMHKKFCAPSKSHAARVVSGLLIDTAVVDEILNFNEIKKA